MPCAGLQRDWAEPKPETVPGNGTLKEVGSCNRGGDTPGFRSASRLAPAWSASSLVCGVDEEEEASWGAPWRPTGDTPGFNLLLYPPMLTSAHPFFCPTFVFGDPLSPKRLSVCLSLLDAPSETIELRTLSRSLCERICQHREAWRFGPPTLPPHCGVAVKSIMQIFLFYLSSRESLFFSSKNDFLTENMSCCHVSCI